MKFRPWFLAGVVVAAALTLVSCYRPSVADCTLECTAASGCPAGLDCAGGFCVTAGGSCPGAGDAGDGGGDDAGDDAGDAGDPDGALPTRRYTALAVGAHHACAIDTDGRLWCWGDNEARQLALAPTVTADAHSATPVLVDPPVAGATWGQVWAGAAFNCARLLPPGGAPEELWCWGENYSYQTGDTLASPRSMHRVDPPAGQRWGELALGTAHACAVVTPTGGGAQQVMCWGANGSNQLGTSGGTRVTPMPVDVTEVSPGTTTWTGVVAGNYHTCAIADGGVTYCWGDNTAGQTGTGATGSAVERPRRVSGALTFASLAAGESFTCGVEAAGHTLRCWGSGSWQQLGATGSASHDVPWPAEDAGATGKWKALALGQYSGCGIHGLIGSNDPVGAVKCWGGNDQGERGDGTFDMATAGPQAVAVDDAFAVGAGHGFACALVGAGPATGGELRCWGDAADGQLGTGTASDHRRPVRVGEAARGGRRWAKVVGGRGHTCAILAEPTGGTVLQRELYCWGRQVHGEVDGTVDTLPRRYPTRVALGDGALDVVVGNSHTCVLRATGTSTRDVRCWGSDQARQLGVAGIAEPGPVTVDLGAFVPERLSGAGNVTCALNPADHYCWGQSESSPARYVDDELPELMSTSPVGFVPNPLTFEVGTSSACSVEGTGTTTVRCFGSNAAGQLGWGMATDPGSYVVDVVGLSDAAWLSTGPGNHHCAVTASRAATCWGANGWSQTGVSGGDQLAPVTVGGATDYGQLATGMNHTCGLSTAGVIRCWGNNDQWQRTRVAQMSSIPPAAILAPLGETAPVYTAVAAGDYHTCAISSDGVLYCWGASRWGQVGDGTAVEPSPVPVLDGTP